LGRVRDLRSKLVLMYSFVYTWLAERLPGEEGGILRGVLLTVLTIVILGAVLPALWPMMTDTSADIAAINGTDTATAFLKTGWPIAILVIGVGVVAALVFFALRQFGVIGGKGKGRGGF